MNIASKILPPLFRTRCPASAAFSLALGLALPIAAICGTVACSGNSAGSKTSSGEKCFSPIKAAPELEELSTVNYPTSRVWVRAFVTTSVAVEKISQEIPRTLSSEKDLAIGALGEATYVVTRKTPALYESSSGISVKIPVSADISVCKQIGRTCIKYASCNPEFEVDFLVSTEIGKNYEFDAPEGKIRPTKKCVIGIDVTPQIENIARREVQSAQAQIAKQWPRLKPHAKQGWEELRHPIFIDGNTCVHMAPRKVAYRPLTLAQNGAEQHIVAGLGIIGELRPAESCQTELTPPSLPAPQAVENIPSDSRVWFPELLPLDDVRAALTESISAAPKEGETLRVLDVRLDTKTVALKLESKGSVCGTFWVTGKLVHTKGATALSLSQLAIPGSGENPDQMAKLLAHLESVARVPLSSAEWFEEARLAPLMAVLRRAVPSDVEFQVVGLAAGDARVMAATDGLYVLHPVSADLVVTKF